MPWAWQLLWSLLSSWWLLSLSNKMGQNSMREWNKRKNLTPPTPYHFSDCIRQKVQVKNQSSGCKWWLQLNSNQPGRLMWSGSVVLKPVVALLWTFLYCKILIWGCNDREVYRWLGTEKALVTTYKILPAQLNQPQVWKNEYKYKILNIKCTIHSLGSIIQVTRTTIFLWANWALFQWHYVLLAFPFSAT